MENISNFDEQRGLANTSSAVLLADCSFIECIAGLTPSQSTRILRQVPLQSPLMERAQLIFNTLERIIFDINYLCQGEQPCWQNESKCGLSSGSAVRRDPKILGRAELSRV